MQNEQEKDSKISENDWLFANGKNVESLLNYLQAYQALTTIPSSLHPFSVASPAAKCFDGNELAYLKSTLSLRVSYIKREMNQGTFMYSPLLSWTVTLESGVQIMGVRRWQLLIYEKKSLETKRMADTGKKVRLWSFSHPLFWAF